MAPNKHVPDHESAVLYLTFKLETLPSQNSLQFANSQFHRLDDYHEFWEVFGTRDTSRRLPVHCNFQHSNIPSNLQLTTYNKNVL